MAQMYTDRIIASFNGVNMWPPGDMSSFSLTRNGNAHFVQGMTTDGNASGFVKGNNENTLKLTQFMENNAANAPIDFSAYDYESTNVIITISPSSKSYGEHTYEGLQIVLTGCVYFDQDMTGSGQGSPISRTYTFGALTATEVPGSS